MKYVHSLLAIRHHQLKVNRKFNVNFNSNMKYDSVRGKQKTILISQHHWSPTASHPHDQTALTLLLPPPAYPHLYAFCPHCFWKFKKIGKKRVMICITNMCFLRFTMENGFSTEAHRGFVLDSEQKIKTQLQTIWP